MMYSAIIVFSLIVLILLPVWQLYWAYNLTEIQRSTCQCQGQERLELPNTTALADGSAAVVHGDVCNVDLFPERHWIKHENFSRGAGRMLYGTLAVQRAIFRHQHPSSCAHKKFLVYKASGSGNGIGSVIHKTTVVLQAALDMDRILVLYPQRHGQWVDAPFCLGARALDACYFEPVSSCSIRAAMGRSTWDSAPRLTHDTYALNADRVLRDDCDTFGALFLRHTTPKRFHGLLAAGNLSVDSYYWWRAQGVAYLVRPNHLTSVELERRRREIFGDAVIAPRTLSVHVRHGDKAKESHLAPDEMYLAAADALVKKSAGYLNKSIFLSTEDAHTVLFFSRIRDWSVRWTQGRRQWRNFRGSTAEFAKWVGWDEDFLNGLVNLDLALQCDAWVGMISSNWNRLVDELRSTVRCKFDHPYVDVFVGSNITDHDWR